MKKSLKLTALGIVAFILFFVGCATGPTVDLPTTTTTTTTTGSKAVTLTKVTSFGSNPGALTMYKYVPADVPANAPLVVALHGCTQDAAAYAHDTEWHVLADKYKFYVVYAETTSSNNSSKCFNWFESGDIARNSGEALSIKQMVDKMKTDYTVDNSKVFVTGLSAGAAMTTVMLAVYPDVFASGAVMAGIPYKCATSMSNAFSCMSPGADKTPSAWKTLVTSAYSYSGTYPTMAIFHGATDSTVKNLNATELVDQWTAVHGTDQTADATAAVGSHTVKTYKNGDGKAVVIYYSISSMGHAISVDPGTGEKQGGATGSYAMDKDLWSSYYAAEFFGLLSAQPTELVVTADKETGSFTAGTAIEVTLSVNQTADIYYTVDGTAPTVSSTKYTAAISITGAAGEVKTLKYFAKSATAESAVVAKTYTFTAEDVTAPVITADKETGTFTAAITVSLTSNEAATIYYTINGSTPTESSLVYSSPISISATTTLKYFGKDTAGNASAVQSQTYTININNNTDPITPGVMEKVTSFGSNPGNLAMYRYTPSGISASAPVVVALHGCTQDAAGYAHDTEWNVLADKYKFYVIYPEQNSSNNQNKCFNWFEPGDITRGQGEALSIYNMVMSLSGKIDTDRVFVTGLSAGAAMTTVMLAAYPDVFASGAVMAGIPYKCATTMTDGFTCMRAAIDKTDAEWAALIPANTKKPRVVVFQGTSDYTVYPGNADDLVAQWTGVHGTDKTADGTETISGHEHKIYKNSAGVSVVETYLINGMGHAITVDPGTGAAQGGATAGFAVDKDLYSSYWALKFFGLDNSDVTPPEAVITAPASSITAGTVSIDVTATDNVGVTKVEFYIGTSTTPLSTDTTAPYNTSWTVAQDGLYTITVKAYDAAGNIKTVTKSVTVSGGQVDGVKPVVTVSKDSGSYSGSVDVVLSATDNVTASPAIFYTTDGSDPVTSSTKKTYTAGSTLKFTATTTIKVTAKDDANNTADIVTKTYTITSVYSEEVSATVLDHALAKRINWYPDYGTYGAKYGYQTAFTLYKLTSTGTWVDKDGLPQ
ncbi:MAG TPA: hypothetical protein DHW82_10100 [Spirochaetia bacterium]|nr:MAG: hypothetical protein A2Y41_14215 [Spirochaetes bacterium GWB1_36_13]HCL57342.1 hypothetical protein [Spirochaetia bacterium]